MFSSNGGGGYTQCFCCLLPCRLPFASCCEEEDTVSEEAAKHLAEASTHQLDEIAQRRRSFSYPTDVDDEDVNAQEPEVEDGEGEGRGRRQAVVTPRHNRGARRSSLNSTSPTAKNSTPAPEGTASPSAAIGPSRTAGTKGTTSPAKHKAPSPSRYNAAGEHAQEDDDNDDDDATSTSSASSSVASEGGECDSGDYSYSSESDGADSNGSSYEDDEEDEEDDEADRPSRRHPEAGQLLAQWRDHEYTPLDPSEKALVRRHRRQRAHSEGSHDSNLAHKKPAVSRKHKKRPTREVFTDDMQPGQGGEVENGPVRRNSLIRFTEAVVVSDKKSVPMHNTGKVLKPVSTRPSDSGGGGGTLHRISSNASILSRNSSQSPSFRGSQDGRRRHGHRRHHRRRHDSDAKDEEEEGEANGEEEEESEKMENTEVDYDDVEQLGGERGDKAQALRERGKKPLIRRDGVTVTKTVVVDSELGTDGTSPRDLRQEVPSPTKGGGHANRVVTDSPELPGKFAHYQTGELSNTPPPPPAPNGYSEQSFERQVGNLIPSSDEVGSPVMGFSSEALEDLIVSSGTGTTPATLRDASSSAYTPRSPRRSPTTGTPIPPNPPPIVTRVGMPQFTPYQPNEATRISNRMASVPLQGMRMPAPLQSEATLSPDASAGISAPRVGNAESSLFFPSATAASRTAPPEDYYPTEGILFDSCEITQ